MDIANGFYWESIPVGKENAATYAALEHMWGVSTRQVRKILEALSKHDNGDNYVLIRSSKGGGFYRTDDPQDIAAYKRECHGRAIKTLAQLRKINRVLRGAGTDYINYSFTNNIKLIRTERGLTQGDVCRRLRENGHMIDESILSRFENGVVLPTPALLDALADILSCAPFYLMGMSLYGFDICEAHSGLQVPQMRE